MKLSKRTMLAIGTFAALLPFGVAGVQAAGLTSPIPAAGSGVATSLDRTIELIVRQKVAAGTLSAADAATAREQLQLQFLAMPADVRERIMDAAKQATNDDAVARVGKMLNSIVADAARQQFAEANRLPQGTDQNAPGMTQKLGLSDGDLVFVATAGPCRVADTRLNLTVNWPGPVAGFTGRQIWAYSSVGAYDYNAFQGGTGIAGVGNCAGTVYTGVAPVSVVATVAVVNTSATGYLRAWNGGTTLTVGGILGWNAGDVLSNTTVIPLDRTIAEYPGSGPYKRDFAVYNNSGNPVDVIVDVVGYFIANQATPLQCTTVFGSGTSVSGGTSLFINAPSCPSGYTAMTAEPTAATFGLALGTLYSTGCRVNNFTGGALTAFCDAICCRIPGR